MIGGGDFSADRIIPDCIRAAVSGKTITVRNPSSVRPYQHVLECLYGYLLLAARQYVHPELAGSYNFGPNEDSCVTTSTLVDLFCKQWGQNQRWDCMSDGGPHEASFLRLDCAKAKQVLGWHPYWSIGTAIHKTIEFVREVTAGSSANAIMERQIREYFSQRSDDSL